MVEEVEEVIRVTAHYPAGIEDRVTEFTDPHHAALAVPAILQGRVDQRLPLRVTVEGYDEVDGEKTHHWEEAQRQPRSWDVVA